MHQNYVQGANGGPNWSGMGQLALGWQMSIMASDSCRAQLTLLRIQR